MEMKFEETRLREREGETERERGRNIEDIHEGYKNDVMSTWQNDSESRNTAIGVR